MGTGKVLLGVVTGIAVGALLGILIAPEKGSKTRKKIYTKGEDYSDELKEKFNDLYDSITEKFESVKKETDGYASKGKSKYEETLKDVKNHVS